MGSGAAFVGVAFQIAEHLKKVEETQESITQID